MWLLDKPLSQREREEIRRMLDGNICRVCVSDDPEEIIKMLGFAVDRLSMLAYNRIKTLNDRELDEFLND